MLTPITAFPILADAIRTGRRHPDYTRVNELREKYFKLITGEGTESLLLQVIRREDAEAFRQRVAITQLTTISWAGAIMQQFYRPGRLRNVKRGIAYKSEVAGSAEKIAEIESRVSTYFGSETLEKWLASRFVALSFQDPNAFVVTEFKSFDPLTTKAQPYPVEYGSDEAILFNYQNNILEYLIVKQTITKPNDRGALANFDRYTMYLADDIVVAEQLPSTQASNGYSQSNPSSELPTTGIWDKDEKDSYQVTSYQPRGGKVQAVRVGYQYDEVTKGRTFVNPFHKALPFFMKAVQETSTMDLSIVLHAFPQKIFYAIPCPGMPRKSCLSGVTTDLVNGAPAKCARCEGRGVIVHKSAQDALAIPLPPAGSPPPAVGLKDMVVYVTPDITLLQFLDTHLRSLRTDAIDAVFNSGISTQQHGTASGAPAAAKTATEVVVNDDRADNTLAPFTDQCAAVWRYTVGLIAELLDNGHPDLALVFEYPASCRIKTYTDILAERKAAADAGTPHYVIQEIDRQLAEMLFSTDAATLARIKAKNYFTPFLGKSSDEVIFLFTSDLARQEDKILWSYVDTIFDELAEEQPGFFLLTRARQWEYIKPKVDKIASELPQGVTALALPAAP